MNRKRSQAHPTGLCLSLVLGVGLFGLSALQALPPGETAPAVLPAALEPAALDLESLETSAPVQQVLTRNLRIRWQAKVRDAGGEFVLYSLTPGGFEEVARRGLAGKPGAPAGDFEVSDFEIRDPVAGAGLRTYQLRFRDSEGRERTLITSRVEVEQIESVPLGSAGASYAPALVLSDSPAEPSRPVAARPPFEGVSGASQWTFEPSSPPPRTLRAS